MTYYVLRRLKSREAAAAMRQMGFRAAEVEAVGNIVAEAREIVQALKGRKTNAPRDAYFYLASLPPEMLAFIPVELPNAARGIEDQKLYAKVAPDAAGSSRRRN